MALQIMCWNNHILKLQKNKLFHVIIYILWLKENILVLQYFFLFLLVLVTFCPFEWTLTKMRKKDKSEGAILRLCGDSYLSERLSHLPQEVLGELDGFVHGKVQTAVTDVLLNPARKFPTFVCSSITLWTGHTLTYTHWLNFTRSTKSLTAPVELL